ncbi:hypothetical protein SAMN04487819_11671 [Actinopolyspora alba]|uniref:Uncharacterized protein n=1 Tax=Actinopolyspora alba TaxID=673379 RepID=A0A1I2BHI4_9ACTN|nr:hypothetical protein [Actinopolyspora alba]SFE54733.1 hypothetical protein SAMN04487819_11671 [Actinopolyspora alba]
MSEPRWYRVRGPLGAVFAVQVPSRGVDERTFRRRVADGEWTVLERPGDTEKTDPDHADGTVTEETGDEADTAAAPDRPAQSAAKSDWISYVVGALGVPRAEVESYTKQDLIDLADEA